MSQWFRPLSVWFTRWAWETKGAVVDRGAEQAGHLGLATYLGVPPRVSVVILALNESTNLAACLRSCAWCDDVHVIDSGSNDESVAIATSMGVHVHRNIFESFAQQRNWVIDNVKCKHPWQFHLDADERFTAELVAEMLQELGLSGLDTENACYRVPNRMIFMDQWLRRSADYPAYQVRLIHSTRCRFIDAGHGQRELTQGSIGILKWPYLHFPFSNGLMAWLARHNLYSDYEAKNALATRHEPYFSSDLCSSDRTVRRRALKRLSFAMPARSVCRFIYQYILKGGFLEGRAGLAYCQLLSMYEGWIGRKMRHPDGRLSWRINQVIAEFRQRSAQPEQDLEHLRTTMRQFRRRMRESASMPEGRSAAEITDGAVQ